MSRANFWPHSLAANCLDKLARFFRDSPDMKTGISTVTFALVCLAFAQNTQAVSPPPDGGYFGFNTAEGQAALFHLTSGGFNTAVGAYSLASVVGGGQNTAIGAGVLISNTASGNTGVGSTVLFQNITGSYNTAYGLNALTSNTTGSQNTGIGSGALFFNLTGSNNTAVGVGAGHNVQTANNVICIGYGVAGANVDNTTWIGNVYGGTTVSGTTLPVVVSDQGQLGTSPSAARFKKEIKPMDTVSEAILALKPVTFHYKSDKKNASQYGLIAEDVAAVNPNLVVRDKNGEIYTVRYDAVNAMLLNEFLKEHKKTEKLEATVASLIATVKEQAAQIQKVSAQLAVASPSGGGLEAGKFATGRNPR
jgi:hypothetical protein